MSVPRLPRLTLTLTLLAASLAAVAAPQAELGANAASPVPNAADRVIPGQWLVVTRAGLDDAEFDRVARGHGAEPRARQGRGDIRIVRVRAGDEAATVRRLKNSGLVKSVEPDRFVPPGFAPNDPMVGGSWHLGAVRAQQAWDVSRGAGVTVAILDSGVEAAHPDLAASLVAGWNFFDNNANTADVFGHGTQVAGVAAAAMNNSIGVAGLAGAARIMPLRVTDTNGWATLSAISSALTWAADQGARVANISFQVAGSPTVLNAASYFKSKGGLVTSSAGNQGTNPGFVANTAMIPVSATNSSDNVTGWSSWGPFVALAAPGEGIYTTTLGGGYTAVSGTSFASPLTAGIIAVMMAARPGVSVAAIENALFTTAADLGAAGRDPYFGWGRVDADAAVAAVLNAPAVTADTTAPAAALPRALEGSTVAGTVAVDVSATDNVGVSRVELLANGTVFATDTAAPFGFALDTRSWPNGTLQLQARAVDAAGNVGLSTLAQVQVNNAPDTTPPLVGLTGVTAGAVVSGNNHIRVSASDNSGATNLRLSLRINGAVVASSTGTSLSFTWNTRRVSAGSYTLEAQALDAAGNIGLTRASVTVR